MLQKNDIIDKMLSRGYTKKDAAVILDDVLLIIMEALSEGESVQLCGFGTFKVKETKPREVVDIKTKERFLMPSCKVPKFTAGLRLKRVVQEGLVRNT